MVFHIVCVFLVILPISDFPNFFNYECRIIPSLSIDRFSNNLNWFAERLSRGGFVITAIRLYCNNNCNFVCPVSKS
jgi:hypothetical protein